MTRVLSTKAQDLADDLPPYLADDPTVKGLCAGMGAELQRVENMAKGIRDQAFPLGSTANDYRLLDLWEMILKLPTPSTTATIAQRRLRVALAIRRRRSASGSTWGDLLDERMGAGNWSYYEGPGDYQVTVTLPYGAQTTLTGAHTLPVATITVASTTGFSNSGQIIINSQTVSYTAKTSTTFTGCTGGTGTQANGSAVTQLSSAEAADVEALVRSISPAHLDVVVAYAQGFIIGRSRVGDPL